ncbi:MAG: hydrolase [Syntrophaceae bacterium CG2_30_49_12]|nr:MAG: hydrolase [Syntrophaceae bacterium CG2_30_49_12]PIP06930.1 MAG: hydrolase [Syntrophobacterales bacterium CG23_combo_of_CG06-09_8_20_14_all_48_27]PJA49741.1 MAG: hydrolase [Syntrophobacterales bacterium CG_4_9_14_3_um_filter_49_8]PJC73726.1 MAG: hydrolase [Syntrophobacterales bacterium CG_4_8_14_3_um_filter_49_14]
MTQSSSGYAHQPVIIPAGRVFLEGDLAIPGGTQGIVVFAHGSGSSRHSPRNVFVAQYLQNAGLATLLFDLLTSAEEIEDSLSGRLRFDIALLAERLVAATDWLARHEQAQNLNIGYFGASTGGGAALVAAAMRSERVKAVVSRGGRPDMADRALLQVKAPTLLIVGGNDEVVIRLNVNAMDKLHAEKRLEVVPGASHLFEEPGALEQVAKLAADWFRKYLMGLEQSGSSRCPISGISPPKLGIGKRAP